MPSLSTLADQISAHYRELRYKVYDVGLSFFSRRIVDKNENVVLDPDAATVSPLLRRMKVQDYATDHTLTLADLGKYLRFTSGSSNSLTVPPAFDGLVIGDQIAGRQVGSGQLTISAGSGVTITTSSTAVLRAQHSSFSLVYAGNNVWELAGDLTAA